MVYLLMLCCRFLGIAVTPPPSQFILGLHISTPAWAVVLVSIGRSMLSERESQAVEPSIVSSTKRRARTTSSLVVIVAF